MLDKIPFNQYDGKRNEKKLYLLALSTCGFCRKAASFLDENDFAYGHIHLDEISKEDKKAFKDWYSQEYGHTLSYPTLIIEGKDPIVGFVRTRWEEKLLEEKK
jgi:glutaredoxin-like protein NrdH